jgi:hypothetical protein
MKTLISALTLSLGVHVTAAFGETINLYTPDSKNAGYAQVNPGTGSVDLYKPNGARLGYGRVAPGSKDVDLYKPNGERVLTGKPAATPRSKP